MVKLKLVVDTNIIIDFLNRREPFFEDARKLLLCGRVGEFDLMITSSQVTDLIYILSDGGKSSRIPSAQESLRGLRTFMRVLTIDETDIDTMLVSPWSDPEDFLIYNAALRAGSDAVISRNKADFHADTIPVLDCAELFDWISKELNIDYAEMEF